MILFLDFGAVGEPFWSDMDDMNQYRRATIAAHETVKRLQQEGHSAEAAKRIVAEIINAEEFALMKRRHSFDETRFIERLDKLPD